MKRRVTTLTAALALVPSLLVWSAPVVAKTPDPIKSVTDALQQLASGAATFRDVTFPGGVTQCPHAGEPLDKNPKPLDVGSKDKVEQVSNGGDDVRVNQDYACFPQDETSIAVNPRNSKNVVSGANDYRLGWGTSGFYSSTDNGNHWYDGIIPFPSLPSGDNLDGGGDPAIVHDANGVVYYVDINFNRTDDTSGIFVSRSTNGGFTWSRPCVVNSDTAACGGPGDVRKPGDGTVIFTQDQDQMVNGSVPFNDKEYVAAGPRPTGVGATCFTPFSRTAIPAGDPGCPTETISPSRLYVTWTIFGAIDATINVSFSDDGARSWSRPRVISGSAPFCIGGVGTSCDINQFSTPTVNPTTGFVYVAFENFNTPDENQYLLVRSTDGGTTWQGPFFVTPVYDVNYPNAGSDRPDCTARGQQSGRPVLTNSCFRVNSGGNVVVDRRGGAFADDLYLVMSDNRNGTNASSNTDVFLFKSTDGGTTWIGPTRVNDDRSVQPANRTCTSPTDPNCAPTAGFGNDQWFPWVDIGPKGDLNVVFNDRRLDANSTGSEWPTSRQRDGNYLSWFWGGVCSVTTTGTVTGTTIPASASQCIAPTAAVIPQPTLPQNPPATPILPEQTVFPLKNFTLSDVPSNHDYVFRAGIFMGDYSNVAIGPDNTAYAFWTDSRNGRSSRSQTGRNPICEQSDVFADSYSAQSGGTAKSAASTDSLFLVAPCPTQDVAP